MCRFVAYRGSPIALDDILFRPKYSLIKQSFEARELEEPLNGDGFGVGWYSREMDPNPAVFVSMTPAWSNRNLKSLAPRIQSDCIFAHVRAASVGDISEANCHPFYFGEWMFMHNGGIDDFEHIKREVRRSLTDPVYDWLRGQTDSEHFFGLILDRMIKSSRDITPEDAVSAIRSSIAFVADLKKNHKISSDTYLNICMTNGKFMVSSRYCSNPKEAPLSLYYSLGTKYECEGGVCRIVHNTDLKKAALIVSEPITDLAADWIKVPDNHFIVIKDDMNVSLIPV